MALKTNNYDDIPIGMYLQQITHKSTGCDVLHLCVKTNNAPACEQPQVNAYSEHAARFRGDTRFYDWAKENLPIWVYPKML